MHPFWLAILMGLMALADHRFTAASGVALDLPSAAIRDADVAELVALVLPLAREVGGGEETFVFFDDARFTLSDPSSAAALRRSLSPDFLYATDLPLCASPRACDAFRSRADAAGWESTLSGAWINLRPTDLLFPSGEEEAVYHRFRRMGVLSADQSLYAGDYRAGERTFSLITQVVGRSGRGSKSGRAVIQTFTPENQTIRQAAVQDYEDFYASEIELRRLQKAPPLLDRYTVTASGQSEEQVEWASRYLFDLLTLSAREIGGTSVLGPAPLPVYRVNNRYRYRVHMSGNQSAAIRRAISAAIISCSSDKRFRGVTIFADHDPGD